MINNDYKRIMALDVGDVRIGIAMTDLLRIIASPYQSFTRTENEEADLKYFASLAKEKSVYLIVVGLPLNMDGTEGARAITCREFGQKLSGFTDAEIVFWDERLSTVEAEGYLIQEGKSRKDRKKVIDSIAAQIILESYMKNKEFKMKDDKFEGIEQVNDDVFCTIEYEDGTSVDYEEIDEVDFKGATYAVLEPVGAKDDEDSIEIVKLVVNEKGEDDIEFIGDEEFYEVLGEYDRLLTEAGYSPCVTCDKDSCDGCDNKDTEEE